MASETSINKVASAGPSVEGDVSILDLDLSDRDPVGINDHIKVAFEEVLAEPDSTHSIDCVWKYSYKCFNLWKNLCYIILTTICGIPMAMCWGCHFACLAFQHIWDITPCIRSCEINCYVVKRCYGMCIHACCDPYCEACSNIFNAFRK